MSKVEPTFGFPGVFAIGVAGFVRIQGRARWSLNCDNFSYYAPPCSQRHALFRSV